MANAAIQPGDVLLGRYRVRTILGRSRGLLVEAAHTEIDQRVVLRILPASMLDPQRLARFRRETAALTKLESAHVARLLDSGKMPDGGVYFTRAYLEGSDLPAYVKAHSPIALEEAVRFILQAAEAVAEAHAQRLLLRTIDPSHLFVSQRTGRAPEIKLIDLGTAKWIRDDPAATADLTPTTLTGVSAFASPEVTARSPVIDERADVYSLGALFYFILTGRPPFEAPLGAPPQHLLAAIARDTASPVTRLRGDVPRTIDPILDWALAKTVAARFTTVSAFAETLGRYGGAEGKVLVQRIAALTAARPAAKAQASGTVDIGPEDLVTEDSAMSIDAFLVDDFDSQEDEPTRAVTIESRPPAAAAPLDQTIGLKPGYVAPAPTFQTAWAQGAKSNPPPPVEAAPAPAALQDSPDPGEHPPSRPMYAGAAAETPAVPHPAIFPPAGGLPGANGAMHPAAIPPSPAPQPSAHAARSVEPEPHGKKSDRAQRVALAVVFGVVALLTVVAVGLVMFKPAGTAVSSAEPDAQAPPATSTASAPPKAPPPAATPAPIAGPTGTILAVAVGGTCSFFVNNEPQGDISALRLTLPPGTYKVTCSPKKGKTKSAMMTVTAGGTAETTFNLSP